MHHAEIESEGLRGCVNPVPTLDDVLHSLTALMSPLSGTVFPVADHVLLPAFLQDTFFKYPQNSSPPKRIWFTFCEIKNVTLSLVIETFLELMVLLLTKVIIQLKLVCIDSTLIYFGCEGDLHILLLLMVTRKAEIVSSIFHFYILLLWEKKFFSTLQFLSASPKNKSTWDTLTRKKKKCNCMHTMGTPHTGESQRLHIYESFKGKS